MTEVNQIVKALRTERRNVLLRSRIGKNMDNIRLRKISRMLREISRLLRDTADEIERSTNAQQGVGEYELRCLTVRTRNILHKQGIYTFAHLAAYSSSDILELRGIGEFAMREMEEELAKRGLSFFGQNKRGGS